MLDTSPTEFLRLAGGRLPARYARALRHFRYGPGAAKVDFILSGPVPWAHPELRRAGTVHLGGTRQRMAASERAIARGRHSEDPVILAAQPAVVDPSRAPAGRRVLWAYCHVPNGSTRDMEPVITAALERAAPGFTDLVVDSASMSAVDYAAYNPNYVGGDFGTGAVSLPQLAARPVLSPKPWRTPLDGVYLCSAGTPPDPACTGWPDTAPPHSPCRRISGWLYRPCSLEAVARGADRRQDGPMDPVAALNEIAFWLERELAPTFKVQAFRKAAAVAAGAGPRRAGPRARSGRLGDMKGIGASTFEVIQQAVDGEVPDYLMKVRERGAEPLAGRPRAAPAPRGDLHSHSDWSDGGSPPIEHGRRGALARPRLPGPDRPFAEPQDCQRAECGASGQAA